MAILTHGSDMTLAPAVEPLVRGGLSIRAALDRVRSLGFGAVQLDASLAGLRPRELDHRARRDLTAVLTRSDLRLAGIDLFIPRRHYTDPATLDRALTASLDAIRLAADLGRVPVSLSPPIEGLSDEVRGALVEAADMHAVRLAIHAEDQLDALTAWVNEVDLPALGLGIDPAALLALGKDPVATVHAHGNRVNAARLADWTSQERCVVGQGELDVAQYRIALDLSAKSRLGPVVLDLRSLTEPQGAAARAARAWEQAAFAI